MKTRKPVAYIAPYFVGYWMMERVVAWVGKDYWGNEVGRGKTRKECERDCRAHGYTPVREK